MPPSPLVVAVALAAIVGVVMLEAIECRLRRNKARKPERIFVCKFCGQEPEGCDCDDFSAKQLIEVER